MVKTSTVDGSDRTVIRTGHAGGKCLISGAEVGVAAATAAVLQGRPPKRRVRLDAGPVGR
ncbi:MAG: hypothetical protein ACT4PJ_16250 [Gemmatimonadaceae bacterium]